MSARLPVYALHCAPSSLGSPDAPCARSECPQHLDAGGAFTCALAFVDAHPDGASCEDVAAQFGVSRERVRQLEERALRRIREEMAAVVDGAKASAAPAAVAMRSPLARTAEQCAAAARARVVPREVRDDGAIRCRTCQAWLPTDAFYTVRATNTPDRICKSCKSAAVMLRHYTTRVA